MTWASPGNLFTTDFKTSPYWWDTSVAEPAADQMPKAATDVLIIGSGYTGLSAAIEIARSGRQTLVVDAERAGWGCSTRNGGQISTSVKAGFAELARKYGNDRAFAILDEGRQSLEWTQKFIAEENIDCDFARVGRFHAAHNSAQFTRLARSVDIQIAGLENDAYIVDRQDQRQELGTDSYYGGVVYPRHCSLDPGKYHAGLVRLARQAGVSIVTECAASELTRGKQGFNVTTTRGSVNAKKVVIATNGYTGALSPWQRRRVIPIGSYVIATEPLPAGMMDSLMPKNRIVSDSRKVVFYYRPSPDRSRILFGGRVSHGETNPLISGPRLHRDLVKIFPELEGTRISHSWMGFVAYTFDTLMHVGEQDGLHYAMGYCGSGVGMAGYLGMRLGQQVRGMAEGKTAFDDLPFPTRPLYSGNPWFLGASVMYYRCRDLLNI